MAIPEAVQVLDDDLRALFGARLHSLVTYGGSAGDLRAAPTLAVVDSLTADDLRACASRAAAWRDRGLATPLFVAAHEFGRSLDAFPFEFGAILASHVLVSGTDPFDGLRVDPADMRRACEVQVRSHVLHLREGYIETEGRGDAIADLIRRSAAPLEALVTSVARLQGVASQDAETACRQVESALALAPGSLGDVVKLSGPRQISADEARRIFPVYLDALERLTGYIDGWNG